MPSPQLPTLSLHDALPISIATARADATIVIPLKDKVVAARFLDGTEPTLDPDKPFRLAMSAWVTSPENKLFARAAVNRMWAQLDRKSTRLNSSHTVISYAVPPAPHSFPTRRSSDLHCHGTRRCHDRYPTQGQGRRSAVPGRN